MILKSYLFCQTAGRYQQYTSDQSVSFLKQLCRTCAMEHQIAIHRNGNLMYYAYTYKKSESEIYGLCVVCGEICLKIQKLYEFFQQTLEAAARKGILFRYDEHGRIRKSVENLSDEVAEIDTLFYEIKKFLDTRNTYWEILPPEDLSIPLTGKISFAFNEDNKDKIIEGIRHYHNVIVTMDNIAPSSFARTVERINAENKQLTTEKESLEKEIETLSRQKKQYRWVAFLSIAVIASLIAILFFSRNVNKLRSEVSRKEYSVDSLKNVISNKDSIIGNQVQKIISIEENLQQISKELRKSNEFLDELSLYMPMSVSDLEVKNKGEDYGETIYSNRTTYIYPKLTIYSLIDGSVELYTKFYRPNGNLSTSSTPDVSPIGFSYRDTVSLSKNQSSTVYLSGWGGEDKGHWGSGSYRIEIWYKDMCLKTKTFTIY